MIIVAHADISQKATALVQEKKAAMRLHRLPQWWNMCSMDREKMDLRMQTRIYWQILSGAMCLAQYVIIYGHVTFEEPFYKNHSL